MEIQIHTVHFKADQDLMTFVHEKLEKLNLFHQHITSSEVFLKVEKDEDHANKFVEIKLHIPGKELFVKKNCPSFEEATNEAIDALKKQLIKDKEK